MKNHVLTEIQIRLAHALAGHHGHLWASVMTADEAVVAGTLDAIHAIAVARDDSEMGGITALGSYDGTEITHTTGSGRLVWRITEAGHAFLRVTRPSGDAVKLRLSPAQYGRPASLDVDMDGKTRPRHVVCAYEAAAVVAPILGIDAEQIATSRAGAEDDARAWLLRAVEAHVYRVTDGEIVGVQFGERVGHVIPAELRLSPIYDVDAEMAEAALAVLGTRPECSPMGRDAWERALRAAMEPAVESLRAAKGIEPEATPGPLASCSPRVEIASRGRLVAEQPAQ